MEPFIINGDEKSSEPTSKNHTKLSIVLLSLYFCTFVPVFFHFYLHNKEGVNHGIY